MELQAFNYSQVVKTTPVKITAITSYKDMLFVAGKKGTFIQYLRKQEDSETYNPIYQEANHKENFSNCKNGAIQLLVVPEWNLLFSVNDSGISRHNFSDFSYIDNLPSSKGVSYICVDNKATMLAALCDKTVLIYVKEPHGFSVPKEISVNKEKVLSLSFLQNILFVGTKTHYATIDTLHFTIAKYVAGDTRVQSPLSLMLTSHKDNIDRSSSSLSSIDNSISTASTNSINTMNNNNNNVVSNEILLKFENKGIIYDFLGNPARHGGVQISWKDTPLSCLYIEPYVLSLENKRIEIHDNWKLSLVQSIPISKCKYMCASYYQNTEQSIVCVASESSIYELQMKPINSQINILISDPFYNFVDALTLCSLYETNEYQNMRTAVNQKQGYYYFNKLEFYKACSSFQKAHSSIDSVVSLVKAIEEEPCLPPGVSVPILSPDDQTTAIESISLFLEARKGEIINCHDDELLKKFAKQRDTLEKVDNYLLKCYLLIDQNRVYTFLSEDNSCSLSYCEKLLTVRNMEKELIELYRGRRKHEQAIGILLSKCVQDANTPNEHKCLEAVSTYLTHIGNEDFDSIRQCTPFLYTKDPYLVLNLFIKSSPDKGYSPLDTDTVLHHLKSLSKKDDQNIPEYQQNKMPILFLRSLIDKNKEIVAKYHNDLIFLYIDSIRSIKDDPILVAKYAQEATDYYNKMGHSIRAGHEEGELGMLRKELLEFLDFSTCYEPIKILNSNSLPDNDLLEERTTLLSHLNRHDEALKIIIYKLGDIPYAEEYCKKLIIRDPSYSNTIYITLVKICLSVKDSPAKDHYIEYQNQAISILTRYSQFIDPIQAIQVLPPTSSLSSLQSYLNCIFTTQTRQSNNYTMIKNLTLLEHDQISEEYEYNLSNYQDVNSSTLCGVCKKQIGTSVFCIYPNKIIVHLACNKNDNTICPVTYTKFNTPENHQIHKHT